MWDEAAAKFIAGVGDLVAHKTRPFELLVVVDRSMVQCHGGIQRFYTVKAYTDRGVGGWAVNESEMFVPTEESLIVAAESLKKIQDVLDAANKSRGER